MPNLATAFEKAVTKTAAKVEQAQWQLRAPAFRFAFAMANQAARYSLPGSCVGHPASFHVSIFTGSFERLVALLFGWRRPAAVARFVVAIIVDAVNGAAFWTFAHVQQEQLEHVPTFTDRDASPAVAWPVRSIRVMATLAHGDPTTIDGAEYRVVLDPVRLKRHLELILSGVTGRVVRATPSLNYTLRGCA